MVVYPNPTTGEVSFKFDVDLTGQVELFITDINGTKVKTILSREMESGRYTYSDNISNLKSGVYLASLISNNNKATAKIVKN